MPEDTNKPQGQETITRPASDESVWKRLTRLFRSGPVIRHKIASGEPDRQPRGTAAAYKKEISSLYIHSLASYGQYERLSRYADYSEMEFCISGDTLIATPDGFKTIKELAETHGLDERFVVFSFDHERGEIVPAWGRQARKTRTDMAYRVRFDNGKEIVGTADHRLMLRDGSYCVIGDLHPGDAMMPFYRRAWWAEDRSDPEHYQSIYTGKRWVAEHRLVASWMAGRDLLKDEVVHHINFKKNDNRPENLRVMSSHDHHSLHAEIINGRKWDHEQNAAWIEKFRREHSIFMTENNPSARRDITFAKVLQAAEQNGFNLYETSRRLDADIPTIKRRLKEQSFQNWEAFARAYDPEWRNHGWDNAGEKNPRWDESLTFQNVCDAFEPGIDTKRLASKLGTTPMKIKGRVKQHGFQSTADFCQNYANCKVVSVEPVGSIDLYDLTVDGYKNFATDSVISHNTPEIASALDIYSDEVTAKNEHGEVLKIITKNDEVKQILETLFYDVLNIEFNIWSWTRNLVKYGDFILFVDANEDNGILNMLPIPINEIEREEGYDKKDPFAVRFRWLTQGNMILENWQVVHVRLLGNDNFLPYGSSMIEPARRIWRQLILIEDAMLVYRIVRSPERRVFKVDVGNIPPDQVPMYIDQVKGAMKRQQITDPTTGRVDLRYNPLSVDEDYFIPVRGDKSSDITTLAGGQFPVRKDTLIPLLDGRVITIEQLAREHNEGKENWVHSVQEGTNAFVPGKVVWAGKNYTCDRIHRVWLDDDTYADMAPEHPIVMRDGTKKRADQVRSGESVMPFRTKKDFLGDHDYRMIQDPTDDEWKFIHKTIVRPRNKSAIHHIDFDRFNNRPDNLRLMGWKDHIRLHGENAKRNLHTPEIDAENARRLTEFNRSEQGRALTVERNSARWDDPDFRAAHSGENHWNVKKWAAIYETLTPEDLAVFCYSRGILSFKELVHHDESPLDGFAQYRACLKHHGIGGWSEFAAKHLGIKPRNHQIVRIEVLEGVSDDVYCMTVVGPDGEEDRHNFALLSKRDDGSWSKEWNGFFVGNTGDIDDVQYIQNKMFGALKIPKAYLSYEADLGSKATLAQQDVRFARTIDRIQKILVSELNKIAIIHLFLLGYKGENLVDFELKLANSSIIAEQQYLELWRTKLEIAGSAQEGVFDREFIWKNIFKLSDEDIDRIREGKKFDKIEDLYLEQVSLPGSPGGEGDLGGEGELPDDLGGAPGGGGGGGSPPGGEEPSPGGPPEGGPALPPENAGVSTAGPVMTEVPNIGSTDLTGMKQKPNRKFDDPRKLAGATPTGSQRRNLGKGTGAHRPSVRDPMQVFKRIARGHFSAESNIPAGRRQRLTEMKEHLDEVYRGPRPTTRDLMVEEVDEVNEFVNELLGAAKRLKK